MTIKTRQPPSALISGLDSSLSCLIAGAAMPLCYAPVNAGWLCFFLLLPLLAACRHPDPDTRIFRGLLFGLGYFCVGSYWFAQTLIDHIGYSWPAALAGHILITGACALAPTIFCWFAGYFHSGDRTIQKHPYQEILWVVLLAALWVVIEDIRFQAFGGGPWMSLALSQVNSPLSGFVPVLGEIGSASIVIIISQLLLACITAMVASNIRKALVYTFTIVVLFLIAQYLGSIQWTENTGEPINIALVQTAVSQSEKQDMSTQTQRLSDLRQLSEAYLGKAKLIVWPETVVTMNKGDINEALDDFGNKAMFARSTVLVGAYENTLGSTRFNTAFTLGYEGGQKYQKRHLVPFGEYVPNYLWFLDDLVPGDQNRSLGHHPTLIANSGTLFGISICWEGSFSRDNTPLVRAGAHALINIANEAWFAGSSLPKQNQDAMRIRALETGRPVVRVANFGPGAIINHKGKVTTQLKANMANATMGILQARIGFTPFMRLGSDFITLWAIGIVIIIGVIVRKVGARL